MVAKIVKEFDIQNSMARTGGMADIFSFEELDLMLGNHALFCCHYQMGCRKNSIS